MLIELIAVGSFLFWAVLVVGAIIMSELIDASKEGSATFLALAIVAILYLFGDFNPIALVRDNLAMTGVFVVGYFVVGTLWAVAKWFFYLTGIRRQIESKEIDFSGVGPSQYDKVNFLSRYGIKVESFPPQAKDYKSRIVGWMSLWPASMLWTLINDPVKRAFLEIYNLIGGMLQGMSNKVFKDMVVPKQ